MHHNVGIGTFEDKNFLEKYQRVGANSNPNIFYNYFHCTSLRFDF